MIDSADSGATPPVAGNGTPGPNSDGARAKATAFFCDLCGHEMLDLHCKLICERCGYKRDCSDP